MSSSEIMRSLYVVIAAAALSLLLPACAYARTDLGRPAAAASPYELVVFEVDGCTYCSDFRTQIVPLYAASALAREAPMRFVNVSHSDETRMGLSAAITIAPTVVLFRDGREVDRIIGYTGPFSFLKLVNHMLGRGG